MDKILSLIIPTYNMEKYLDKCLTSLIIDDMELMKQLEVLVIIDGATDSSSEIAHTYEARFPYTYKVIDKENGNYGSCINRGLKEATGKYVKVLDADDSFNTINFAKYLRFLLERDYDLIMTPYIIVDENDSITSVQKYNLPQNESLSWNILGAVLKKQHIQMHAITYKLSVVKNIGYKQTEGISYTDQEWDYTPLSNVESIIYTPIELYRYLVGRVGQTMNPDALKKNISHNEMCVRKIVIDFSNIKHTINERFDFLQYECKRSVEGIYFMYLVKYNDIPLERLIEFDKFISNSLPEISNEINEATIPHTKLKYIKTWRLHKNRLSLIYRFGYIYSKIANRIINYL